MNANLKFRVWCVSAKCWDNQILETRPITRILESTDYIVQQWTGLFDRNNVRIFEGDILKKIAPSGTFSKILVEWHQSSCGFAYKTEYNLYGEPYPITNNFINTCDWTYWIVCGNIFENPELLQK